MTIDDWTMVGAIAAVAAVIIAPIGWWLGRKKRQPQIQVQEQSIDGANQYQKQEGGGTQEQKQELKGP